MRRFRNVTIALGLCSGLASACVKATSSDEQPGNVGSEARCPALPGLESPAIRNARTIIVGELHGTAEIPAMFGDLVCHVSAGGASVLVGLEFEEDKLAAFTSFLNSAGTLEDRATFLEQSGWLASAERFPDGRTSEAMFALVNRLRVMRASGARIALTTFIRRVDGDTQTPYEMAMAESISLASRAGSYDKVLVLVGNLHARTERVVFPGSPGFEPMAMHLPEGEFVSLNAKYSSGAAWNCQRSKCEARPVQGFAGAETRSVSMFSEMPGGYDGEFIVGPITASPPKRSP
jgi:hypothetical protein